MPTGSRISAWPISAAAGCWILRGSTRSASPRRAPLLREVMVASAPGDRARRSGDAPEIARRLRSLDMRWAERQRLAGIAAEVERARRALDLARARRVPLLLLVAA